MATPTDQLLSQFIDAWNSGHALDVDDFLARASAEHRAGLARDITTWLEIAPTPAAHARGDTPDWLVKAFR
jgi:hypothetical protein